MRCLVLPLLFFFHLQLHAQYDDLLRNPDITWVAEYTTDFELNPVYNTNLGEEYNLLNVIRLENLSVVNSICAETDITVFTNQFILDGLINGAFSCFADSLLKQPLPPSQLRALIYRPVTIINFDHGDTIVSINEVLAEEIKLFRARQVLYYNARERMLDARLLALAPVISVYDEDGNNIGDRPLVWIKIPVLEGKAGKKLLKTANYVVQSRMQENAPKIDQTKPVKSNFDLQKWASGEVSNPSHHCLSADVFTPISTTELTSLLIRRDTIIASCDDLNKSGFMVIENNLIDLVEKIRFVQNWYFDERSHAFDCRVVAVAPLAAIRDSEGNFRYYKPLFYVKY